MSFERQFQQECGECASQASLYALGALPEVEMEAFGARLQSGCPLCTTLAGFYSDIGGLLAAAVPSVQPPSGLRQLLLDRIRGRLSEEGMEAGIRVVRSPDSPWIPLRPPGVDIRSLMGEETFLLRMQPGASFPAHEHKHNEQCYVLEGSIVDSQGLHLNAGDFVVMLSGTRHDPIHSDTGCLLLIAYTR